MTEPKPSLQSPGPTRPRIRRRRSRTCLNLAALMLLAVGCGLAAAGVWIVMQLPAMVDSIFGPPNPALSTSTRLLYTAQLYWGRDELLKPLQTGAETQAFRVEMGESIVSISARLEEQGIIRSADLFRKYLVYSGQDTLIQAGDYVLDTGKNALEITVDLLDATPASVTFFILPGWRVEELAAALPTSGVSVSPQAFLNVVRNPENVTLPAELPPGASLEGYLMPGKYELDRGISAVELVNAFLARFDDEVTDDLRIAFEQRGLSLAEAVTLASMVQREAVQDDEKPKVAAVFFNRLGVGMKLDSDPTAQYALGYIEAQQSWWKNPLTQADLTVNSPYNTYVVGGLPAGPICNPGLAALRAVADPAPDFSEYFYFRAECENTGYHTFSRTYDEHVQKSCP